MFFTLIFSKLTFKGSLLYNWKFNIYFMKDLLHFHFLNMLVTPLIDLSSTEATSTLVGGLASIPNSFDDAVTWARILEMRLCVEFWSSKSSTLSGMPESPTVLRTASSKILLTNSLIWKRKTIFQVFSQQSDYFFNKLCEIFEVCDFTSTYHENHITWGIAVTYIQK